VTRSRLVRPLAAVLAAGAVAAAGTAPAWGVSTEVSSNWSGYAVSGKRFTAVSGTWVEPAASCTAGSTGSVAAWVGLGGNSQSSDTLEQIGTEVDCSASGTASYSMWYELVPAAAVPIKLQISAGDSVFASVTVSGTSVTLRIENLTRKTSFSKTLTMASPDLSSAEWIVEVPSLCSSSGFCRSLSLANFGKVTFKQASATGTGHTGSISDSAWSATAIELAAGASQGGGPGFGGPGFGGPGSAGPGAGSSGSAVPGTLSAGGRAFTVTWTG
jgi:hypothetical protein